MCTGIEMPISTDRKKRNTGSVGMMLVHTAVK